MSVLFVGAAEKAAIKAALDRARAKPIRRELLERFAMKTPKGVMSLADRSPELVRPESEHVQLGTYRASVSFEEQPIGLCMHLSVSSHQSGKVPNEYVMRAVAEEFGISEFPPKNARVWLEEFEPGHHAINVVTLAAFTK